MDKIEAKILLKNLLQRITRSESFAREFTEDEIAALHCALLNLSDGPITPTSSSPELRDEGPTQRLPEKPEPVDAPLEAEIENPTHPKAASAPKTFVGSSISFDYSSINANPPPDHARLCLDFGTAMSKVTLVEEFENDDEAELITVLNLGIPGDQEEYSERMLISSVYIDNLGRLWFGKKAVEWSLHEGIDGSRQRLDNIKRRLSEDGWDEPVTGSFNPSDHNVTYGELVLAYLMYLTWTVNQCLEDKGHPKNLMRRFAMPCFKGERHHETIDRLKIAIGQAQILADTFRHTLNEGLPLDEFIAAVKALGREDLRFPYVAGSITEPLGVAGSLLSWNQAVDMLILIVDVGAGTSDLSLFRIHVDTERNINSAFEIEGASRGIQAAGNHLDQYLIELVVRKSGLDISDPLRNNVRSALQLNIRNLKESLFNDSYVMVQLVNGSNVEIELEEFLNLEAVIEFGNRLKKEVTTILEEIDSSFIDWVTLNPLRNLVVALTGGGAELPMVTALATHDIMCNGRRVPVQRALAFPKWLEEEYPELEDEYPQIAVSLGGARKHIIEQGAAARITAADAQGRAVLDRF